MVIPFNFQKDSGAKPRAVNLHPEWMLGGLCLLLLLGAASADAHRIEKRFAVDGRPVVAIHNDHGKITVKSWNRSEIIVVAEHQSDKVEVDAEQMRDRVEVTTHILSSTLPLADRKADYEITVPEETELQIKNDAGMIIVERVSGEMTFETVTADVKLTEVAGTYLLVKTMSGSLYCVRCAGRIEVNSISGNIKFLQPISSNVRAKTYSGGIFFDGDFLPGGKYELNSMMGPIEVRYADSDSFELLATSQNGKVEKDSSFTLKPPTHQRSTATPAGFSNRGNSFMMGTFGSGLARVNLTSLSGTITIRKRE